MTAIISDLSFYSEATATMASRTILQDRGVAHAASITMYFRLFGCRLRRSRNSRLRSPRAPHGGNCASDNCLSECRVMRSLAAHTRDTSRNSRAGAIHFPVHRCERVRECSVCATSRRAIYLRDDRRVVELCAEPDVEVEARLVKADPTVTYDCL